MINFETLDKTKTYLGLQYGTSLIAKKIKKYSKCYAPETENIPTHVLAIVYRDLTSLTAEMSGKSVFARERSDRSNLGFSTPASASEIASGENEGNPAEIASSSALQAPRKNGGGSQRRNGVEIASLTLAKTTGCGDWWIYESHMDGHKQLGIPAGVRRYRKYKWLEVESETQDEFECIEFDFDFETLEEHIGEQYGTGDIAALMRAAILNRNGKQKDRNGLICSEYLALANPAICEYYDLPPHCITPAHFQDYLDKLGVRNEELKVKCVK